jgi:hypothetical protein
MNSKEQSLRPVEIEHILDQFNNFIQRGKPAHIGGRWFAQENLYHVHKDLTASGNSHFELCLCQNRNGVWGCGECEETAPAFVQLWAKLNSLT